jgi:hypothetical protein
MTISDERSNLLNSGRSKQPTGKSNASGELSQEVLRNLLHPKEPARALLVWISAWITVLVLFIVAVELSALLIALAAVGVAIWFSKRRWLSRR